MLMNAQLSPQSTMEQVSEDLYLHERAQPEDVPRQLLE